FRGDPKSFQKAMETYRALAALQERDPRLRIHSVSTATHENLDELRRLADYLFEHCPKLDHVNLALIRGDRKNPTLQGPDMQRSLELWAYIRKLWSQRENHRLGGFMDPLIQWAKVKTANDHEQSVPCRAGVLHAVVYSNGDLAMCETLPRLGSLR